MSETGRPAGATERVTVPAGALIFAEGEPADWMYLVQEGTVEVLVGDRVINTVGPGGILGEMALINNRPRSASARAKYDCELLALDEQRFAQQVKNNPAFAIEVMRTLAARLRLQTSA
jgi:CRP-like cAMP-binding protein